MDIEIVPETNMRSLHVEYQFENGGTAKYTDDSGIEHTISHVSADDLSAQNKRVKDATDNLDKVKKDIESMGLSMGGDYKNYTRYKEAKSYEASYGRSLTPSSTTAPTTAPTTPPGGGPGGHPGGGPGGHPGGGPGGHPGGGPGSP